MKDGLKLALGFLRERRDECPGVVPVLVCHDEVVIERGAERAAYLKALLERAMLVGMETVLNGTDEIDVSVEGRIASRWGGS